MKSKTKIFVVLLTLIISTVIFTKQASAQESYVSFQVFYDQLSPYGQWVDNPNYGYVWIPDAGSDFFPYSSRGHWVLTDYGWTWVSYYDWGWAPFHYGRWDYDNYYGWFWIPDNEWGPAWVIWRSANGYYGWSPMRPGISINVSFNSDYGYQNDHWIFVRDRYIDSPDIYRYYVNRNSRERIYRNSTVINNTYIDNSRNSTYIYGPKRDDVQQNTGRKVNPVSIQENNRPGQELNNGELRIYRPKVMKNNDMPQKPAPARISNPNDVKRSSERNTVNQQQNVTRPANNRTEQQTESVKPQNNNTTRPSKEVNRNQSNENKKDQQVNTAKPSRRDNNDVQKNSKSEKNKKKTE